MENFKREIFEQIGNLLYAIADDQHVTLLESGELKMLLKDDWLMDPDHTSKENSSEAPHLIMLTVDTLQAQGASAKSAFQSFTDFYTKHREQFTEALKERIMDRVTAITRLFPSKDRQKNNHVIQLQLLFQNSTLAGVEE